MYKATLLKHWKSTPIISVNPTDKFFFHIPLIDGEPNWDALRKIYGQEVYINRNTPLEWREVILAFEDKGLVDRLNMDPIVLDGYKIDSFTIQAQRNRKGTNVHPGYETIESGIFGITRGLEGNIILGLRGGADKRDTIIYTPAGAITYQNDDPITNALYQEANEEAGIRKKDIIKLSLIGVCREEPITGSPVHQFLYVADLNRPSKQIISDHKYCMDIFESIKQKEGEIIARKLLKLLNKLHPNLPPDAWENQRLITIDNTFESIATEVEKGRFYSGMYASSALYVLSEFGKAQYKELMSMQAMKKVDDSLLFS